jgi:acyl carrier protein
MRLGYRLRCPENSPSMNDISLAVRRFIGENFLFRDDGDAITHDASLLDAGIIDSTGVLELVCYLETTFGIEVQDDEMLPENLDSIRAISHYVARKLEPRKVQLVA